MAEHEFHLHNYHDKQFSYLLSLTENEVKRLWLAQAVLGTTLSKCRSSAHVAVLCASLYKTAPADVSVEYHGAGIESVPNIFPPITLHGSSTFNTDAA